MLNRIFLAVLVLLVAPPVWAKELSPGTAVPESRQQIQLSFAPLVKKVAPAVVNIYTKRSVSIGFRNPFIDDPFFRQFFSGDLFGAPMRKYMENALGSGVIIEADGLVVTNAHVIKGAEEITVALTDGREFDADMVLRDEASDLALLRMRGVEEPLPVVALKPSESMEVGDLVLAIGNPFGVGQTVTSGIVSAQGRSSLDINDFNFFIQTDAAINPGNSGGPLVALDGSVVGINTAIYSRSGGSMGLGFAIPSEMVASVVAAEKNRADGGKAIVIRPWLGIGAKDVSPDVAESLGLARPSGALIAALHSASPLLKGGVKIGDIVTAVNGRDIRGAAEMKFRMATVPIGKSAIFTIVRLGKSFDVKVPAMAPPDEPLRNETILEGRHPLNGATIGRINPAVVFELGLGTDEEDGVIIYRAPRGTRASRVVRPGDVLLEINGREIKTVADAQDALKAYGPGEGISLAVKSRGRISRIYLR